MIRKAVSFGEEACTTSTTIHTVEKVPQHLKSRVWYNGSELQLLHYKEIEKTRAAFTLYRGDGSKMEQRHHLTWRGIESIRRQNNDGTASSREEKNHSKIRIVVEDYKRQIIEFGDVDDEDLRALAKAQSKKDRVKARRMGKADEEEVQRLIKEEADEEKAGEQQQQQQQQQASSSKTKTCNNHRTIALMNMMRRRRNDLSNYYDPNHKSTTSSSRFTWFQNNNKSGSGGGDFVRPRRGRHNRLSGMTMRAAIGA